MPDSDSFLPQWQRVLQQTFGFNHLRPGQQPVVEALLAGRSAAAIFPTGSGKSLCYQLPALMLPHLTLVVSPLLALMQDQVAFLQSKGIAAASIDSSQSREQVQQIQADVRSGKIKILMVSVERLKNERFRQFIEQIPISLLVVDEAHCISEWGHNFRPDYLKLPDYCADFKIPQVLLLTATATKAVIDDMCGRFQIQPQDVVTTGFYRPNLRLLVQPTAETERRQKCLQWLQHLNKKQSEKGENFGAIIYVTLQQTAHEVADYLAPHLPFPVKAYHAGLSSDERDQIQQEFMVGTTPCIVATIAFGMGVDKSNIRQVMHYDLPKSIENYSQEIGRAGRDGLPSDCVMLADSSGFQVLENFVYGDTPELSGIHIVLDQIRNNLATHFNDQRWEVLMTPLSALSNIRLLPLKTLLVNLEMRGILTAQFSYFAEYKYKLTMSESELLANFDEARQQFLQQVFNTSQKARSWITLDTEALIKHTGDSESRRRAIVALEYCQEKGWLELQSKQMTDVYRVDVDKLNQPDLAQQLASHFAEKERSEIQRIQAMLQLLQQPTCLSRSLAHYFNDFNMTQDCGHCSVCIGKHQAWPQPESLPVLQSEQLQDLSVPLQQAIQQQFNQAASVDLLTRYLAGITAPWLTKVKARQLGAMGVLEHYPYAQIKNALTKNQ
ncbi:ATP-dependent DNA helicase RecQ [Bacterioplanoides sp. SCSIO 12839]|uniref:RecQ family ATP-dependent DNA helicase n=1 Tax=Bacterioplanoides sp. SCSIO 12839 TaxID=2829569 RepID=UPI00210522F8|nr:RecQ family ATP-dependent DNA helicase [Bacterioplanoides sp. SCSIO 12839]UTW47909.1 RecQ family ATP-dependent DNA helicase [Bacterioplanoides sp. SCSIO 12839]